MSNVTISIRLFVFFVMPVFSFGQSTDFETLQQTVRKNDELTTLIKMSYTVTLDNSNSSEHNSSNSPKSSRQITGQIFSSWEGTWAQDGIRQFSDMSPFYFEGVPDKNKTDYIRVINGQVSKIAEKPDFMRGSINTIEAFVFADIGPVHLGMKLPKEPYGLVSLSELIDSTESRIIKANEIFDEKPVCVIESRISELVVYELWIDQEKGIPLQILIYSQNSYDKKSWLHKTVVTKTYQLPNGGWVPIQGDEIVKDIDGFWINHIAVNENSITTDREKIPESLFDIVFPEGAIVYNAITGNMTKDNPILNVIADSTLEEINNQPPKENNLTTNNSGAAASMPERKCYPCEMRKDIPKTEGNFSNSSSKSSIKAVCYFGAALLFSLLLIIRLFRLRAEKNRGHR